MRILLLALTSLAFAVPAFAQDQPLLSLSDVQAACEAATEGENARLFSIVVAPSWRFGTLELELADDGSVASSSLPIDTRRNFRALGGHVEAMPAHLETMGFVATESRAAELEAARQGGALLRIGFFLGFDDPRRSACLVRGAHGVTMLRMDVAFLELIRPDGTVVAREDTDRFASWSDDHERDVVPGTGPRAMVGDATLVSGARVPEAWQRVLSAAELNSRLTTCHRDGVGRGASGEAMARMRLSVDARSGRVSAASVEVANVGDEGEVTCLESAFDAVSLPAGPPELAGRAELSLPIRFAH
jgi:hypothetical protein